MQARGPVSTLATLSGSHSFRTNKSFSSSQTPIMCNLFANQSARGDDGVVSAADLWLTDRLFYFIFIPGVISANTYPITTIYFTDTRDMTRVFNSRLEFRKSQIYLFQSVQKPLRIVDFHVVFSLGDLAFSITAQKRFDLGEIRKQINHQELYNFENKCVFRCFLKLVIN